eukprot:tig00001497_g9214.t1
MRCPARARRPSAFQVLARPLPRSDSILQCTLPLGVLKEARVAFEPPLPEAKRRAIAAVGFAQSQTRRGRRCYTHVPAGCGAEDFAELARPAGRLLFAGEHTDCANLGTTHAALQSGEREARRLLTALGTRRPS